MSKRKREENPFQIYSNGHNGRNTTDRPRLPNVVQILDTGKKNMVKSLKLARGFERQKLGRRQKKAKESNDTSGISRLESEVTALKVRYVWVFPSLNLLLNSV